MTAAGACGGKGAVDVERLSGAQQDVQHIPSRKVQKQAVSLQQLVDCRFNLVIQLCARRMGHES